MRTYTSFSSSETQKLLDQLLIADSPSLYRDAMRELGNRLAERVANEVPTVKQSAVCIACTVEDADFLARGLLEGLERMGVSSSRIKLVCFWNERVRKFNGTDTNVFDVAPVVKEYREVQDIRDAVLIVVKSIISGACVVKTNLASMIDGAVPLRVIVAAPVMLKGAEQRLASEFPQSLSSKFEYFAFAIDDEKGADDNVVPGIGGSVYERLGFDDKTAYVPEIVKERRRRPASL
jgi:hypothetical protein